MIKAEAGQRNFHNFIEAILQNQAPSIIHKMTIEGKVFAKKTNKKVYSRKEDTFQMAPNSTVKFGFDMKDTEMVAGDYEVVMNVTADTQHYELKKNLLSLKKKQRNLMMNLCIWKKKRQICLCG